MVDLAARVDSSRLDLATGADTSRQVHLGRSLVIGHLSVVIGQWSLVIGHWFMVIGHWSLVIGN